MTHIHSQLLMEAHSQIEQLRETLDNIMYYTDPLEEEEYQTVRRAYDLVCKANDELNRI